MKKPKVLVCGAVGAGEPEKSAVAGVNENRFVDCIVHEVNENRTVRQICYANCLQQKKSQQRQNRSNDNR